ncbi:hypothetical protein GTP46_24410 [Duganella sp. FT135W]|uniref:Uncharacterized protein n=1 Tax=Duganella flavida TaxID=2692175 RepID=A0A6L8KFA9_9BURK|nr:hypothetical protein [Duganella flavida]MYM25775.1 hypothetical protein [Duganella flavida]
MTKTASKADSAAASSNGEVKARVLIDCDLGMCNEVILVDPSIAETLTGVIDTDPAAVEYAESLAKE